MISWLQHQVRRFQLPGVPHVAPEDVPKDSSDDSSYYSTQLPSQYLSAPPNEFQGFGAVTMSNVLTLDNGQGMNPDKSLYLWENLVIKDNEVFAFNVSVAKSNADKTEIGCNG